MSEQKYCEKCGRPCNMASAIERYNDDTGEPEYSLHAKCPKYGFFSPDHSWYKQWPGRKYWQTISGGEGW